MRNNFAFLWVSLIALWMVGCKPATIDINEELKQQTEETFAKTPSRSYLSIDGNDLRIVEYTFDQEGKTATRKEVNFQQKALYSGIQQEDYSYAWGDFGEGLYGRYINLTGNTNRTLFYVNNQLNDGEITTTILEPRADKAANMIDGLTSGAWETGVDAYVYQLHWVDTIVYEITWKGKVPTVDTIFKRLPRPNYYDIAGVDSCIYYTYAFSNDASSKEATLKVDVRKNVVDTIVELLPQYQDPSQFDTIITYQITDGERVAKSTVNFAFWSISDITTSTNADGEQEDNLDVMVAESGKDAIKLAMKAYSYDGKNGSFNLNNSRYEKQ